MNYYVYQYLRENNTPYYIGSGCNGRAYSKQHTCNLPPKERIVFVETNMSEEDARQLEIELIAKYGRKDNGTGILRNLTDGGEGSSGRVYSEETKQKLREARALQMISDETRKKMSEAHTGRVHSEETKAKMAKAAKGRKKSPEELAKIREARAKQVITTKQVTCPHCGKTGGNRIMPRYHFDNCKAKG
jgi:hypothetical protein